MVRLNFFRNPLPSKVKGSDNAIHSCLEKSCSGLLKDNENLCYDATLKPDLYANQLREQARRLSLSKSSGLFIKKQNKNGINRGESLDSENTQVTREALQLICVKNTDSYQLNELGIPNEIQSSDYLKSQNDFGSGGICSQPNLPLNDTSSREETSPQFKSMNPNMDTSCRHFLPAADGIHSRAQSSSKHFEPDSSKFCTTSGFHANQLSESYISK